MSAKPLGERVGGAPISWGVCEAPGWGHELAPERVLGEMSGLGLSATELGPTGYLGATPDAVRARLAEHDMCLIGGFLPVTMHVDTDLDLSTARAAMEVLAAGGSQVVVLAAQSVDGSYDRKIVLTDDEWPILLMNLQRLQGIATELELLCTLHPHVGTAIEDRVSVLRLIASSNVMICLDTGHLFIGGMQPSELLSVAAERIAHVHLKDVNASVARTVTGGRSSYIDAVRAGLYTPLGDGDLDINGIVGSLEAAGYRGWYVLEQDAALAGEPPFGTGPVDDVRASVAFLNRILA